MEDQNMEPVWHPLCSFHESIWWIAREPFGKRRHNLEGGWMSLWSIPLERSKSIFHCQFYPVCVTWGLLLVEDCWIACDRSIPSWWCAPLLDSCQGHSEWNQSILSIRFAFLWMQKRNLILTQQPILLHSALFTVATSTQSSSGVFVVSEHQRPPGSCLLADFNISKQVSEVFLLARPRLVL